MTLNFSLGQWPFLMRAGIFEGNVCTENLHPDVVVMKSAKDRV